EKPVQHQARKYGETKFGVNRFINGFLDFVTIWILSKFGKQPRHLLVAVGVVMSILGLGSALYMGASILYILYINLPDRLVTINPWFYIALTSMIIGTM